MEDRLLQLLQLIVEEYVATAEPVASGQLRARYKLDVSPATIRNWMGALDREGYLMQPYTSGGRIPTETGYAAYVESCLQEKPATRREQRALERAVTEARSPEEKMKRLAKTLSELSGQASIVGFNPVDTFYTGLSQLFAQPEFQNWQRVVSLTEILDHLDDAFEDLRKESFHTPAIRLGESCAFGSICGSVLLTTKEGMIGLLGPIRMDYQHALSLMRTAKELL